MQDMYKDHCLQIQGWFQILSKPVSDPLNRDIVKVNFMCQLDWVRGAQTAGKRLFMIVPLRMFWEELSICIHRYYRDPPSPM